VNHLAALVGGVLDQPDAYGEIPQGAQIWLDAGVGAAHVIEVFGVAQLFGEMQLVQAGTAAEGELFTKQLVVGDLDDQA
jgi:hypothetical protein